MGEFQTDPEAYEMPEVPNHVSWASRTRGILAIVTPDRGIFGVNLNELSESHPELAGFDNELLVKLFEIVRPESLLDFAQKYSTPIVKGLADSV